MQDLTGEGGTLRHVTTLRDHVADIHKYHQTVRLSEPDNTAISGKWGNYKLWTIQLNCRSADKISDRKEKTG